MRLNYGTCVLIGLLLLSICQVNSWAYSFSLDEVPDDVKARGEQAILAWVDARNEEERLLQKRVARQRADNKTHQRDAIRDTLRAESQLHIERIKDRKRMQEDADAASGRFRLHITFGIFAALSILGASSARSSAIRRREEKLRNAMRDRFLEIPLEVPAAPKAGTESAHLKRKNSTV